MELKELTEQDILSISAAYSEPEWVRDRRLEAFKAFTDLAWPTMRDEEWRYTNPSRFHLARAVVTSAGETPRLETGILAQEGVEFAGLLRIVDGGVVEVSLSDEATAQGVLLTDLTTAVREHRGLVEPHLGAVVPADEKFAALSLAAFTGGAFIHVPDDVELAKPLAVSIQVTGGADTGAVLPRVLAVVGAHSIARVYVDHAGDAPATVVEAVEVVAHEGSRVAVVTAQDWGDTVDHVGAHTGLVGANADYRHLEVTFGGRTVYLRPDTRLDHPGANAELLGVYFVDEGQHVEHRSLIHHNASQTTSDLMYKGALQGRSKATFFGNIRIEEHARATASDQTNRNLILSDGAKADSIPFLEIKNSDVVRCGHHSSVGQIDEMQLFYLESRGIPRPEAARLLLFGFFAEVIDRVDLPGVSEVVLAEIEREIRTGPTALMDPRRSR